MSDQQRVSNEAATTSKAETDMGNSVDQIRATIARVTEAVDSAKRGWQGSAFDACKKAGDDWDQEAARLNKILDEMTGQVGHGNKTYTGLEQDNENEFRTLISQTGGMTNLGA
ncbi:WXG100 family type VII secretion target [Nocardia vermiculata]|uniref:WXG100 family type VII secretion target n=1 Tax=Nocardia vermiculata TaxID=257274 RepID=A0A846XUV5_9NOCA|nr:WXG100 family type VII secretion target [Nocardia vermiculata]NKY50397.1 WXG100 family type VII secretion target [Nocardia vermiculata]